MHPIPRERSLLFYIKGTFVLLEVIVCICSNY